ncbi:type-1 angiotensin II receptor-like [Crassostrea angulata]|uniref:type-1 angiotensin II receptor-like n=1 Tax=Magallana angulata TaxID=2784310 RepID=UPI0022B1C2E5|nr:type-1 angiotensin II receptor-like [Crassostrea angulata]
MGSKLNLTESERLSLWDETRIKLLIPTTVFLILCAVVGVFGNGVVIYIYGLRLPKKYEGRYFIPYLALADLFAVVISVELHTVNNFFPVTYKMETLCKWNFVFGFFASGFASNILLIIAVQRYLKVCKPLGGQMTLFWRRFSLCLTFVLLSILIVPTYFTFGIERVYNKELNVNGTACRRLTSSTPTLSLIRSVTYTLIILIGVIVLIVLYILIAKVIYQQHNQNRGDSKKKKTNISLMFMIITIIFLVLCLPRMITSVLEGNNTGFWETLNVEEYAAMRVLQVVYILNHVANPFVYAFLDVKFKTEFKQTFMCRN